MYIRFEASMGCTRPISKDSQTDRQTDNTCIHTYIYTKTENIV